MLVVNGRLYSRSTGARSTTLVPVLQKIYFTRVIVILALLVHQTYHSQNKFFPLVAQYTVPAIHTILLPLEGQEKEFFYYGS